MSTPPDLLALHAANHPDKPAVLIDPPNGETATWSFRELDEQANRLAGAMLGLGVSPGETIIWCGMNSLAVTRMMHASRKAGVTSVPLNYRLAPEEKAYIIDNSDASLVYADAEYRDELATIRDGLPKVKHWLVYDGEPGPGMHDVEALLRDASPDKPAIDAARASDKTMIYTSGTTGKPKGAVRSAGGDPELLRQLLAFIGYVPEDIYLTTGPLYHSGPGGFAGIAHAIGNTIVLQRKFDPEDWLRLVEKHRVSTTFSAPTPIRMVTQLPEETKARYDRSSMKRMIANAAPWSFSLKKAYLDDFPDDTLWEIYGSTELGVDTILRPQDQLRKPGSCGLPAPGVEIALFDEEGNVVEGTNVPGELFVRTKAALETYYKADEKFESSRRGDWLTVGDMAYRDEEGFYYICDRKGDMIISGGMNIYPAEIEAALEAHPDVMDVAVFGIPSEQWGESVHAAIVRRDESLTDHAVMSFAREHLAGYKLPRSIDFIDEIPRNASGKILKKELREPYWKDQERRVG